MDAFIKWCKQELTRMQASLDHLESGAAKMQSKSGVESSWVDAVPGLIEGYKRQIAELEGILERHQEAG